MTLEPTLIYCVDVLGRLFSRGMYRHQDGTWWSHPTKRVNPLEKWRFHSQDQARAVEASQVIRRYQKLLKELDAELEALRGDA